VLTEQMQATDAMLMKYLRRHRHQTPNLDYFPLIILPLSCLLLILLLR
jgi:hypothetical protein